MKKQIEASVETESKNDSAFKGDQVETMTAELVGSVGGETTPMGHDSGP